MHTLQQLRSGELQGIRRLDLSCGLTELPPEIYGLADTLEVLNLSDNALRTLPHELTRLRKLRVLFCSGNPFTVLPEVVGDCAELEVVGFKACDIAQVPAAAVSRQLRWLILTANRVSELPRELGHCARLQKLMLAGNRLRALPGTMANCTALELLRIAANRFEALPPWLFDLPRLSWLAYAGNPFCDPLEAAALQAHPVAALPWSRLELQQQLGEGASGVISRAVLNGEDGSSAAVAVKLFKGAITSDGLPRSEMTACIAAGAHRGLIPVIGRIDAHPLGTPGLVMTLIGPQYRNLAGPPSLQSCSRDVYADDVAFTRTGLLRMATTIASAVAHLHARGILHGDLYAHNTLWNGSGDALIGDFGAASFFAPDGSGESLALQRIETRAFACLLEELLQRCSELQASATQSALIDLRDACLQAPPAQRPTMNEVERVLATLT